MNIVSVTQVLGMFRDFSGISNGVLSDAIDRGRRVHNACFAYVNGLFIYDLGEHQGYFESFKLWFDEFIVDRANIIAAEEQIIDMSLCYSGTPDLICELSTREPAVIDYKTPINTHKAWRAQLAAYSRLAQTKGIEAKALIALKLNKDGSMAKAIRSEDTLAEDWSAFYCALQCWRYFRE